MMFGINNHAQLSASWLGKQRRTFSRNHAQSNNDPDPQDGGFKDKGILAPQLMAIPEAKALLLLLCPHPATLGLQPLYVLIHPLRASYRLHATQVQDETAVKLPQRPERLVIYHRINMWAMLNEAISNHLPPNTDALLTLVCRH